MFEHRAICRFGCHENFLWVKTIYYFIYYFEQASQDVFKSIPDFKVFYFHVFSTKTFYRIELSAIRSS